MRRRTPEEKYKFNASKQNNNLEKFAEHEFEWANDLLKWYGYKKIDIPDDEYRACAFFLNKEYIKKPGSLSLLYEVYLRCIDELPEVTRENAFDILRYHFRLYAKTLHMGGY